MLVSSIWCNAKFCVALYYLASYSLTKKNNKIYQCIWHQHSLLILDGAQLNAICVWTRMGNNIAKKSIRCYHVLYCQLSYIAKTNSGSTFTNMVWLKFQHDSLIECIRNCGVKLLKHSQVSIIAPLKFKNGYVIQFQACIYLYLISLCGLFYAHPRPYPNGVNGRWD